MEDQKIDTTKLKKDIEVAKRIIENQDETVRPIMEFEFNDELAGDSYNTGFESLNEAMSGGFRGGDLVVISGISGQGKTLLSQSLTYSLCKQAIPCLWFSYEVSLARLHEKFEKMDIGEQYAFAYAPKKNTSGSIEWIMKKIEEADLKFGTKIVFIDHIDFLVPRNIKKSDNESIILKQISIELKELAVKLNICIVLMAHLKKLPRGVEEPEMQDIGYCLPAGSKILNADNGRLIDIEDIYNNKKFFNVISFDKKSNQVKKPIIGVIDNGVKNVYKITTTSGYAIEASEGHRFFKDNSWIELKNLKKNDYLAIPGKLPSYKNNDFDINLIEIIGWMLGDGYFPKNGTGELVLQDKADLKHIIKLLKNTNVLYKYYDHKNWFVLRFQTRKNKADKFINKNKLNDLKKLIIDLNLIGKKGKNKKIPDILLQQNNKIISVLLRGLFQADGCVSNVNLGKKRLVIDFSNISKDLIIQIRLLLLRFGIRSKIRKGRKGKFELYRLTIEGKESIINFNKHIKLINKKGKRIKEMVAFIKKGKDTKKEIHSMLPPIYKNLFFLLKKENNITWKELNFRVCHHQNKIKKEWWNKLCKLTNNENKIISEDIDFDQIKNIEFIGKKRVYDIEVSKTHNFVCNGLYTHNSAGIFQLADYVLLINRIKAESSKFDFGEQDIYTDDSKIKLVKNRLTGRTISIKAEFKNYKLIQKEWKKSPQF